MRTLQNIVIFSLFFLSCSREYLEKRGEIIESYVVNGPRGFGFRDVAKIKFESDGRIDTIAIIHTGIKLNKGDSVLISLDIKNPSKSKLKQVTSRYDGSEAYIPIDSRTEKLYQYYSIDKKPLFGGVTDFKKNDSSVQEFLKRELIPIQDTSPGRIVIYLVIDDQGKATVEDILLAGKITEMKLRKAVEKMPMFEPGEHAGKKVKVSYLVEIK